VLGDLALPKMTYFDAYVNKAHKSFRNIFQLLREKHKEI
jgi:ribosomal 50S subunit-associated protein YjgA (DUF615 family)